MSSMHGVGLESALRDALRGFEVIERDLTLPGADRERHVDFVGHDVVGRLVFVTVTGTFEEDDLLRTWLALAFAREARRHAGRPWLGARLDPARDPLVVVVADSISERMSECLALLPAGSVAVLERRVVSSRASDSGPQRGEATRAGIFLVRRELATESRSVPRAPGEVIGTWPEGPRNRALDLTRRVARVDPAIALRVELDRLSWEWNDRELATLSCPRGVLEIDEPNRGAAVVLSTDADTDAWIEDFVAAHAARLASSNETPRPLDLLSRGAGPLLTAEEIAAFRDI